MKAQLFGKKIDFRKGSATLEILIAFVILTLSMSAVIFVSFGNQSLAIDSETNTEALGKAQKILEDARALSRQDYGAVVATTSTETSGTLTYNETLLTRDITECKKQATSTITWQTDAYRTQKIELTTFLTDIQTAIALGGDCITDAPTSDWTNPARFASDTYNPGKPTSLDVLDRFAYQGSDKAPFFYIADTRSATLGQTSGIFVTFTNGFNAGNQINSLDAIYDKASGQKYVYAAMDNTTNQLEVINVTDPLNPTLSATIPLSSCVAGSYPQGWLVRYFGNRVYLTTRFTAGPELHIFDTSNPASPVEIGTGSCKGTNLGDTVNDFIISEKTIGGVRRRFLYMATDEIDKELRVFEVTNDVVSEVTAADKDLPNAQNGESVFVVGNKLYFGRQSAPGASDLYIFDITNPLTSYPTLGSADIGTSVIAIRIAGQFAFLATSKVNEEFQIWNILDPSNITLIKKYNFGNVVNQGIDYEPDYIYATGQSTPNFQILYSIPPFVYTLANGGDITVTQGFSGSTSLPETYVSGTAQAVTLTASGLPSGATATFTNNSCTPTCTAQINVTTTLATPVGTYPITVTGNNGITTIFNLVVNLQSFDYTLSNGGNITMSQNQTVTGSVTRTLVSGTPVGITVTASGYSTSPGNNTTITFSNNPCSGTCTSVMTIKTKNNTPLGTYTITVTGSPNGAGPRTTTFTLKVQ